MNNILQFVVMLFLASQVRSECIFPNQTQISFCSGIVNYRVSNSLNISHADLTASNAYSCDYALWKTNRVSCLLQIYEQSICDDCLAVRREFWCAQSFPRCFTLENEVAPICQSICQQINSRCSAPFDCILLPQSQCSKGVSNFCSLTLIFSLVLISLHIV